MELEILVTGVAGQGVQLAAKTMALAATREGRQVMMCPEYGGSMRGGSSLAQVAIGDGPLRALPVFHRASHAIALHEKFWEIPAQRLRPDPVVVMNGSLCPHGLSGTGPNTVAVPATELATEIGDANTAALITVAAFCTATGLVSLEALVTAVAELLPPYRRQHLATNERALRVGAEQCTLMFPSWAPVGASS